MKQGTIRNILVVLMALAAVSGGQLVAEDGKVSASYLYTLSNFSGVYPSSWARIGVDESKGEVYVVSSTKVKIFNENGMEVFTFNEGAELGLVTDVAVDEKNGDIIVLGFRQQTGRIDIIRCNFRGELLATIEMKNLPTEFSGFMPNRIALREGDLYLANTNDMLLVVTDAEGTYKKGLNMNRVIEKDLTEKEKQDIGMTGFSVDREGRVLFTNSNIARVFRLSLDGKAESFGMRGGTAGKFGVPSGVVADATGKYLLVADLLRCKVMIFDKDFQFQAEFGVKGNKPENLVGPMHLAVDGQNRLYVSQLRDKGVNVYQLSGS
jgi:sporulation protein YlmC with PRC-barrel domain